MTADAADETATLFHALADPMRVRVLGLLGQGERCVCDLMAELDVAQSRLSWHLKTLKEAGLVSDRREGRWSYYTLERAAVDRAEAALATLKPRARRAVARADSGGVCG